MNGWKKGDFLLGTLVFLLTAVLVSGCLFGKDQTGDLETGVMVENYTSSGEPYEEHFASPPRRVIAVWQDSVETVIALGAGDSLVAAIGVPDASCLKEAYRAAYEAVPLRQQQVPGTEEMLMMEPDLILAWRSTFSDRVTKTTDFWHDRGIHTYIAPSSMGRDTDRTIEGECRYIENLGRIFGREERAAQLVTQMKDRIAEIHRRTEGRPAPRAIIVERQGYQYMNYGEKMLAADILRQVGGELVPLGRTVGAEDIVETDPDVIFLIVSEGLYGRADEVRQEFVSEPALQGVAAVENQRVYVLPLYMVYASATRTLDGIEAMAQGLYPDLASGQEDGMTDER